MKNNKKIASLVLASLLNTSAFAATNWDQLVTEVKSAEYETVRLDDQGRVEMNIVKLANDKVRFVGFNTYGNATKMKLTIHSPKIDLEKICNDYSLFKKSFAAELTFNVAPISDNFQFTLKNGKTLTSADFENPFVASDAEVSPLTDNDKFPWTLNSGDLKKFRGDGIKVGFANLINSAIKKRSDSTVVVDLSNFNGLACDLAAGYIKPTLTKTFFFEKALPDSTYWIGKESFSEVYKNFWADHSRVGIVDEKMSEETKATELLLLGMTLAGRDTEKENIFKNKSRAITLLNSLKYKNDPATSNLTEQWKQTFEYKIPSGSTQVKQKMTVQYGDVYTAIAQ